MYLECMKQLLNKEQIIGYKLCDFKVYKHTGIKTVSCWCKNR